MNYTFAHMTTQQLLRVPGTLEAFGKLGFDPVAVAELGREVTCPNTFANEMSAGGSAGLRAAVVRELLTATRVANL